MRPFNLFLGFICTLSFTSFSQQLIINEVSQGTGSKEYVEFVVAGNPTCITPVPCMDLRGVVLDDNNGYFAAGGGNGIAPGAIRFANTTFWSCIPQGTIILIYDNTDVNPAIPPMDVSMTDGNCRLIIPINSTLFEGQSLGTTSTVTTYPASGSWIAGAGDWNQVSMNNLNDSFLTTPNSGTTIPTHGVSWGSNDNNTIISFSGGASGKVFYFANSVDNDPFEQTNWISGNVGANETPGVANNPANDAWIGSMNPNCGVSNAMNLILSATPDGCSAANTGTASVAISGGQSPYTILWSNGGATTTISNLAPGTYTVDVEDAGGCSATEQITVTSAPNTLNVTLAAANESCDGTCDGSISSNVSGGTTPYSYGWSSGQTSANIANQCDGNYSVLVTDQNGCTATVNTIILAGPATQDASILTTGPFTTTDPTVQFQGATNGGTWTADCGVCITPSGVFNPQTAGAGTYQICYAVGAGICAATECVSITVTEGCTPQITGEDVSICPGTSITIGGQTYTQAGEYPTTFTDVNGCDSTHIIYLTFFSINPPTTNVSVCDGDSVLVFSTWYYDSEIVIEPIIDVNGCTYDATTVITFQDCTIPNYEVFIPNTFTPNNDNVNDIFSVQISGGMLETGSILNRWGQTIHDFSSTELTWNGTAKNGMPVEDGVYTYIVGIRKTGGVIEQYHGFVTVVR